MKGNIHKFFFCNILRPILKLLKSELSTIIIDLSPLYNAEIVIIVFRKSPSIKTTFVFSISALTSSKKPLVHRLLVHWPIYAANRMNTLL